MKILSYSFKNVFVSKQKYIFIINSNTIGGHEFMAAKLIVFLKKIGRNVDLFCTSKIVADFLVKKRLKPKYLNVLVQGNVFYQILKVPFAVNKISKLNIRNKNVIVCGGSPEAVINLTWAFKILKPQALIFVYIPMLIDRQVTHGYLGCIYNLLMRYILCKCDIIITINKIQQKLFHVYYKKPVIVFKNNIEPLAKPLLSFGKRLLYIGRLDNHQKNIIDLINKLDTVKNPFRSFYLIGDGPDDLLIRHHAKKCKWIKIFFQGWLSKYSLNSMLGSQDVLVLNSRWEGEPLVAREFKQRGLLRVGTDIPGHRSVIPRRYRYSNSAQFYEKLQAAYNAA